MDDAVDERGLVKPELLREIPNIDDDGKDGRFSTNAGEGNLDEMDE